MTNFRFSVGHFSPPIRPQQTAFLPLVPPVASAFLWVVRREILTLVALLNLGLPDWVATGVVGAGSDSFGKRFLLAYPPLVSK